MGSYCHICGNFVNSLDDCDLPYGGAPAPRYDGEPSDRSAPDYDRWPARRPWVQTPTFRQENLDVLENPYYVPPSLPEKFEIFLRECPPAYTTRSNTRSTRQVKLNQVISPLLKEVQRTHGVEKQLVIVDQIYVFLKDNMDILKKNVKLYDVSKLKLDEIIRDYPVEAGYLKTLRNQMFVMDCL